MTAQPQSRTDLAPDKVPLTESQATRLSALTGIDASRLKGFSVAEISSEFRWQIDPNLFLFTRVCGKVVKQDPATGVQYPVPFANVYAEDTTCSLLGFFPGGRPFAWFFPFYCHTQVVSHTTTDACGNFCFWVPRFEIEWILRFRTERFCFLQLFNKPTVASVIAYLQGHPIGPDPGPEAKISLKPGSALYQKAEQLLGVQVARQLATLPDSQTIGGRNPGRQALLARPAFPAPLPPPLPRELRKPVNLDSPEKHLDAVRSTLANNLRIDAAQLERLNLSRYHGPYLRCIDVVVPEWVPILEVPDLSFRVTQDVNGTGTQEVIYSGGLFDVPWGSGNVANVTLLASPIAASTTTCATPDVICGNQPSLEYVGLRPLVNPGSPAPTYVNAATGFATRPNAPHPGGTLAEAGVLPSTAPYTGTLQLYGCANVDNAAFYRLRFTYTAPGTTTASTLSPFTGITWPIHREVGGILHSSTQAADANGWYPVLPPADGWFPSCLLDWDTIHSAFNANGLYTIQLEVADGGKTSLATSASVGLLIDNSVPAVTFDAVWSFNSDLSGAQPVPTNDCVVIDRGVTPRDVYIQLTYSVAANHLKYVQVSSGGCAGGASLYPAATTPAQAAAQLATVQHWYEGPDDNSVSHVVAYKIAAAQPQGVYSFDVYAASRAFNPAGSDEGSLDDWIYNPTYVWTDPSFGIAVVNA